MKYHKLFNNHTEYESYLESSEYKKPCLAYCRQLKDVHYKKKLNSYEDKYFTIEALEDGNVYFKYMLFATTEEQRYMEYSKDGGETWNRTYNVDEQEVVMTIPLLTGETAFVRGDNDTLCTYDNVYTGDYYGCYFYSDISFNASGNIMSLIYGETFAGKTQTVERMFSNLFFDKYNSGNSNCLIVNAYNVKLPATTLANRCYESMFRNCTLLTTPPELPATTLTNSCYAGMFWNCTSLTTAPELPATTLANNCYSYMFDNCTSLTTAPELPATTLADSCYYSMFGSCTSLTTAPELPATTLADYCYYNMFERTSLTTAPELPVTTLANYCYYNMFGGCKSLTTAPELPATTLANYCYSRMFYNCTSLITAPELPATTLANNCYESMFGGCKSLTTAPELPATTLANYCYNNMFNDCTLLTTAPLILPATTLANNCYGSMFYNCKLLTTAPELPATILKNYCYSGMFLGCSKLNYIKAMFTTIPSTAYTQRWVDGVSQTGTFVKNSAATWTTTGVHGVPSGWTVQTASA